MIYLAPLQGFTDFVYREAYDNIFNGVDKYFTPYIVFKNGEVPAKYLKEVIPENNKLKNTVVPQILVKDEEETVRLVTLLNDFGYQEINLNFGCPYPMVTKRGRGAGLLPFPEKIKRILSAFFENFDLKLSVKLRAGLELPTEIEQVFSVLNEFPLDEIILHPRIAKQLYKGEIISSAYSLVGANSNHRLVYNGDIFTIDDFRERKNQFSETENWMLGRGILMNPFLPAEVKQEPISEKEKLQKLIDFHENVFEKYAEVMDNPGNTLNKMQQFWIYFSYNFSNQKKAFKLVKKSKNILKYKAEVQSIFRQ